MGVTGYVYIDMTTQLDDTSPVRYIKGEQYPVIQGSGTNLAKALENVPEISRQVLAMTKKLNALLDENNLSEFSAILANFENLSRDMNGLLSEDNVANVTASLSNFAKFSIDMKEISSRFDQTADQIDKTADTISRMVSRNEANVNKFTQEGLDQIISMSRETRKAAESIHQAADKLGKNPSSLIYQPSQHGVEIPK
jgi:ABC-type transporter Mla subunit MlaD